jgi:cytochrome c oxidase subunit 1
MLIFIGNLIWSLVFVRERAETNPWFSRSLEWQVSSPPPVHNFDRIPVITAGPYEYGVPNAPPVADFGAGAVAVAGK